MYTIFAMIWNIDVVLRVDRSGAANVQMFKYNPKRSRNNHFPSLIIPIIVTINHKKDRA
jgi:hypothetical protein